MKLTLLGTGCPSVDHKRFGPSNLITSKKAKILVDCGSGITQRLHQIKVSSADIDALLFTHLHSDHAVDFYQLIISSWHSYRIKPWKIFGPKGTKKFVNKIMNAWAEERKQRIAYEARSTIKAFQIDVIEFNKEFEYNFKTRPESTPQVIFKNGTPLIAIRNVTENLIYLLNEKGELLTQPFFGTTNFSIATFQNKTCLIVGSSEGVIYNYHIN